MSKRPSFECCLILNQDQWKIGLTSHVTQAIGVKPYKDVFWTSRSNPGNAYYYDCMEVSLPTDTDTSPWPINYRYVGPINQTSNIYYAMKMMWRKVINAC